MRRTPRLAFWLAVTLCPPAVAQPVPEPDGYRTDEYRGPVPATVKGGVTLATEELRRLIEAGGVVLIDVLPAPRRPDSLAPSALWMPVPRRNIPGSIWLPDVGRGAIADELDAHFQDQLARATKGDKSRPIVIYCLADCWMSWNAVKRAASYGYSRLYWYPDGTEGWTAAGLPVEKSEPIPEPAAASR